MQPTFAKKLGFYICKTKVRIQKIDGSRLKICKMVIALFSLEDKNRKFCFFKGTFFLANISITVVFFHDLQKHHFL